jgi:hypothetical protein
MARHPVPEPFGGTGGKFEVGLVPPGYMGTLVVGIQEIARA